MQSITFINPVGGNVKTRSAGKSGSPIFGGYRQKTVRLLIWMNIFIVALRLYLLPWRATRKTRSLLAFRNRFRSGHVLNKYSAVNNRVFFTYNAPGWPSRAFNRYLAHQFKRSESPEKYAGIHTVLFGITKKCAFKCEHCCEWENLNRKEVLTPRDLLQIVKKFQESGVSQVQFSGGEPLQRVEDLIFVMNHSDPGTDFWVLTTGFNLTYRKIQELKIHGTTGITLSLDHCEEDLHDAFRGKQGSFRKVFQSAAMIREAGLALCFSLCPTNRFITAPNLQKYMLLCRDAGASFVQILEPRAVGHYAHQDVALTRANIDLLEDFYERMNYSMQGNGFPIISYHGYYSRRTGCAGSGKDYVYVDTDGDVHSCPFCRAKLFSALYDNLPSRLRELKSAGCKAFGNCTINEATHMPHKKTRRHESL